MEVLFPDNFLQDKLLLVEFVKKENLHLFNNRLFHASRQNQSHHSQVTDFQHADKINACKHVTISAVTRILNGGHDHKLWAWSLMLISTHSLLHPYSEILWTL